MRDHGKFIMCEICTVNLNQSSLGKHTVLIRTWDIPERSVNSNGSISTSTMVDGMMLLVNVHVGMRAHVAQSKWIC